MATVPEKGAQAAHEANTAAAGGRPEPQARPDGEALRAALTRNARAWEIYATTVAQAAVTDSRAAKLADARTIAAGAFRLADEFEAEEARQGEPDYRARFVEEGEARRLVALRYLPVLVRGGREIRGQQTFATVDEAQTAIRETAVAAAAQGRRYDSARIEAVGSVDVELPAFRGQEEELDDDD